jgi:DNA polymerase-1
MNNTIPLLLLIDGHSLAFRSYYAFAMSRNGGLRTSKGIPTSVCFGFLNSLLDILNYYKPKGIAIGFDRKEPTFRHEADVNYKANRQETPTDFILDIENLHKILSTLKIPQISVPGYEADDVIGTLAELGNQANYQVKIISGDRDLFQLVRPEKNISILYLDHNALKNSTVSKYPEFGCQEIEEKMGIRPDQIIDYKSLCGDKSDNIPGVKGIGDKTAITLLKEYQTLENIYQNIKQIKETTAKKLEVGKQEAFHSKMLATIHLNVPHSLPLEETHLSSFELETVSSILEELELKKILQKVLILHKQLFQPLQLTFEIPSPQDTQITDITDIKVQIVDTRFRLEQLVEILKLEIDSNRPVAWDTETTGLNTRQASLVGIGCCWGDENIAYIPTYHPGQSHLDLDEVLNLLRPILEGKEYPKVLQNAKYDRLVFKQNSVELKGVVFDTLLASYLLNPEEKHKLSDLCTYYQIGVRSLDYKELNLRKQQTIADLPIFRASQYCGLDAYATYLLFGKIKGDIEKYPELKKLLIEVEQPLEIVLAQMERDGVSLDIDYLEQFSLELAKDLQATEKSIYHLAGEEFNINSPKQVGDILFEKLLLDSRKSRKTKTGYSTDQAILEKLQGSHPIIDHLLHYRTYAKLKSTYVDALPKLIEPSTQRLHTDFNQAVTSTGRLSSSNPNLQNIPIRTEFSRRIRKAFIPTKDWIFLSADYSQIELRILTHLTQEPILLQAYQNGEDVHRVTAKILFEKEEITPEERNLGKTINFGVIYGMGAQRFAKESHLSARQGKEFIERYRAMYSHIFEYLEQTKKQAIVQGYVTTILGRRRYFNFSDSGLGKYRGTNKNTFSLQDFKINQEESQMLRSAANAPIQGSSADIIKVAMVKLHDLLKNYHAKILIQVHDELVFEMPPYELEILQPKIKMIMENAVSLTVPLLVEMKTGKNWMMY